MSYNYDNQRRIGSNTGRPAGQRWQSDSRSVSEFDEDEKQSTQQRPQLSPLTWFCDFAAGKERKTRSSAASKGSDHGARPKSSHQAIPMTDNDEDFHSFTSPEMAAINRMSIHTNDSSRAGNSLRPPSHPYHHHHQQQPSQDLRVVRTNSITQPPPSTSISMFGSPEHTHLRPIQGEARIVAPHVSKLSPQSAVEIRLQSNAEYVAVLCSVDVLKMRSTFFHDILIEQEKTFASQQGLMPVTQSGGLWREPIVIPEAAPFEAAAFLESLHEGRALFRGEWNMCWARLSVTWVVEDLVAEFAGQIEEHMTRITQLIQQSHWRTNPNALCGLRVAIFRKNPAPVPTVITGIVSEATTAPGYSKLRVAFDSEQTFRGMTSLVSSPIVATKARTPPTVLRPPLAPLQHPDPVDFSDMPPPPPRPSNPPSGESSPVGGSLLDNGSNQQIIGDVSEPFWVQANKDGGCWMDPDDLSAQEVRKTVTATDRRIFWEMARSLIDLPELSMACKTSVRSPADVTAILKRPEFRVLWTPDAVESLTKEMAVDLIRAAYVSPASLGLASGGGDGGK